LINYWDKARELLPNSNCLRRAYAAIIVSEYGEVLNSGWNESLTPCRTCAREGKEHNKGDYDDCPAVHAEQMALLGVEMPDLYKAIMYLVCDKEANPKPCPTCQKLMDYCEVTLREEPK
jgi:deoxycytidylate deaminase